MIPIARVLRACRTALGMALLMTLLCGLAYPLLVTAAAQAVFSDTAGGSLIVSQDGRVVGSRLIGQSFSSPKYFWGRPSATTPAYHAAASGASNLSPGNPALAAAVQTRVAALQKAHPKASGLIPADLVTSSASGLDPHISLAAAEYQIPRIARARGMKESTVREMVASQHVRWLGLSYVNVLALNLALDEIGNAR